MHKQETLNRQAWRTPLSRLHYKKSSGYASEGERTVLAEAASAFRSPRVLDIGVGGGRTTALLKSFAGSFTGIDYTPELLDYARAKEPSLRFEHMDARAMTFESGSFEFAFFSFNGIDSVDGDGRRAIMREVSRVLVPEGAFGFSTFNRDWHRFQSGEFGNRLVWTFNPPRLALRLARLALGRVRAHRFAKYESHGEDAIFRHGAHDYGILVYASTPAQVREHLRGAGFHGEISFFDCAGNSLGDRADPSIEHFHVFARKSPLTA